MVLTETILAHVEQTILDALRATRERQETTRTDPPAGCSAGTGRLARPGGAMEDPGVSCHRLPSPPVQVELVIKLSSRIATMDEVSRRTPEVIPLSQAQNPASSDWGASRSELPGRARTGGVQGNERLTALNGLLLLVLLFIEGLTLLRIRPLLTVHAFVGLLLIPPLVLKLASTGYRFVGYYAGSRAYRAAGPPRIILRIIAPILVLSTVGLFGTGIILLVAGPAASETWRPVHTVAFFVWFWLMTVHVAAYVWRVPRLAVADLRLPGGGVAGIPRGSIMRQGLVVGTFLLGLAIAIAAIPWDASWAHWVTRLGPER